MIRRTGWVALALGLVGVALLILVSGCANIWGLTPPPPDEDASMSTFPDAAPGGADARLDARDGARDGGDAEAEAGCPNAEMTCGGTCVNTMTDPKNCGGCGTTCAAGQPCQGGMCMCAGTGRLCGSADGGACVDTTSDSTNCGDCNSPVPAGATCVNSGPVCPTGQTVCGSGAASTCTDMSGDSNNCGSCGKSCGDKASCIGAMCQPCGYDVTQLECGSPLHCVSSLTDPQNCGACGVTCLTTEICKKGKCICPGSETLCGGASGAGAADAGKVDAAAAAGGSAGVCDDLSVDPKNCGACGRACTGGMHCNGGQCVCPAGTHSCGSGAAAVCLTNTSTSSCGTSSCSVCPIPSNGVSTCDGVSCGQQCNKTPLPTLCPPGGGVGAACVNTTTDANHCGSCASPCSTNNAVERCSTSICSVTSCSSGFADCDKMVSDGCEIETSTDPNNCGSCSKSCAVAGANEVCTSSMCVVSDCKVAGTANCDGNAANGCEINLLTDKNNCGACGKACNANNGTPTCAASTCKIACNSGFVDCNKSVSDGCEVNTTNDASNCNGCGNVCSQAGGTGSCAGSKCKIVCDSGHADCDGNVANGCETDITKTNNCGGCGSVCNTTNAVEQCTSTTSGYACSIKTCNGGFDDCDHNASNGCEINLNTDANHCGGCNQPCSTAGGAVESCKSGICSSVVCTDPTHADCDGVAKNGCETAINTVAHCGDCNTACSTNHVAEACTPSATGLMCTIPPTGCADGFTDCDKTAANGCEVNTGSDTNNCGACGHVCPAVGGQATCTNGACGIVCSVPNANCDGNPANGCEVNTSTDPFNCSACNRACSTANATEGCSSSACSIMSCAAGFADCNKSAVDGCEVNVASDTKNCGLCNVKCSANNATEACSGGNCAITKCAANFMDCNMNAADGCEVNLSTDPNNCGICNNVCPSGGCSGGICNGCPMGKMLCGNTCAACPATPSGGSLTCSMSTCAEACPAALALCNANTSGAACVDTTSDVKNCGACGKACAAGQNCCGGACVDEQSDPSHCGSCTKSCAIPTTACLSGACSCPALNPNMCGNACVNEQTDTSHCGSCLIACMPPTNGTVSCVLGGCVQACSPGQTNCSGACVNVQSDATHCGSCSNACMAPTGGSVNCIASACVPVCPAGQTACNGVCVNEQTDPNHCGSCMNSCSIPMGGTAGCSAGVCTAICPAGQTSCNGVCVNEQTDANHCGSCSTVCTAPTGGTAGCSAGMCTASCSGGQTSCSGVCVDEQSSSSHCGSCTTVCTAPSGGTTSCSAGSCVPACSAGKSNCNGVCVNEQTDNANCGGCGVPCSAGSSCVAGLCLLTCTAPSVLCGGACVDVTSNPSHCGTCTTSCAAPTIACVAGSCVCPAATPDTCGAACVNKLTDANNCGVCGTVCDSGTCIAGLCM